LKDAIGDVRHRTRAAGWYVCVVTSGEARVVLGLLRGEALEAEPETLAEHVMESGPRTYRPGTSLQRVRQYMEKSNADLVLVTSSDGELRGIVRRADIERA
jgi:CBS domain-containing protein